MLETSIVPVIVTGVGGGGHGEQIVKALRLGKLRYRIIGTDMSEKSAGRAIVDAFFRVPAASASNYIDELLAIAGRYQARAVFHGSEPEMRALAIHKDRLTDAGLYVPVNPLSVLDVCMDKARTARFLEQRGFHAPLTREITSVEDLAGVTALPAVIKPSVGGGGSANVFIAQTPEELLEFGAYLLTIYPRFIAQQYVGTPDNEYTVGVLFGTDGAFINSIAVKRVIGTALTTRVKVPNRTARTELGPTLVISSGISQGAAGRWPEVTEQCEAIARSLKPSAPVNIQCRLVGNEVFTFEINPRFSGTTSIRAMVGYNEPDVLIRKDVLGESIPKRFEYREATIMRALAEYEIASDSGAPPFLE